MGNALYAQAIGVLLLFAFLFFIFMASKGWRWHHVTALVLIFLSSMFFVFMAAAVLKNHSVWMTRYQQLAQELEAEKQKTQELEFGPLNAEAEAAESLRSLQNELERVIVDRGRVWRDVELADANPQTKQIRFRFPERTVTGVDAAPPLHRLMPNAIIYGFKEKETPEGWKAPAFFMGEFVVQEVAPDSVVVAPALPLDPMQGSEVKADGVTWAFYEVMPTDAHFKFENLEDEQIAELLKPGGWHGRPATAPPEKYEEIVRQYQRDGEEATDADPPERVWTVVELTAPWKVEVDAANPAAELPIRHFDVTGLAVSPELRQGNPAEFEPGEQIELDSQAAQKLIDQGIAKRVKNIYRRPLRDYAFAFADGARNARVLDERARLVAKANDTVQQKIDKTNKEIAYRTEEKTKLSEDRQNVQKEQDAMKQLVSTLQSQFQDNLGNLRALYTENLELVDRIRRIEQAIINAVEQQLASVPGAR